MYLFNCDFLLPYVQNQIVRKKLYFFQILVSLFHLVTNLMYPSPGIPTQPLFCDARDVMGSRKAREKERETGRLPLFSLSFPSHHLLLPCALGEDYWGQVK